MEDPEPMADLLLLFELLILPPIIYESAFLVNQSKKVFTRIGSVITHSLLSIILTTLGLSAILRLVQIEHFVSEFKDEEIFFEGGVQGH
mgnify:CR=1 FL=1